VRLPSPADAGARSTALEKTSISYLAPMRELRVGSWTFRSVPDGWDTLPDTGLKLRGPEGATANVIVSDDVLGDAQSLEAYAERQQHLTLGFFSESTGVVVEPMRLRGADQTAAIGVRIPHSDGTALVQEQHYALHGETVAIVTLTRSEEAAPDVARQCQQLLQQLELRGDSVSKG
jgi:hypothetical protein